ncbi:Transposase, Mutator family, partial [Aerococcus urinaehominis]
VSGNEKYDKAVNTLEEGFEDAIPYLLEPTPYRVSLKTTNSLERLNREIRRREKVVGLFPNIEAAERLIGSVLLDLHEYWETCPHKSFNNIV